MMYGYGGGWGAGPWIAMTLLALMWITLLGAVVWAGTALWRSSRRPAEGPAVVPSARAVLDRRFAAGEIDDAEYARKRRLLEGPPPPEDPA